MIRASVILLLALLSALHLEGKTITTAAELQKFQFACKEMPLTPFVITGRVNAASGPLKPIIVEDHSGLAYIYGQPDRGVPSPKEHTHVALSGKVFVSRKEHRFVSWAYIRSCTTLGPATPPPTISVPIRDLKPGKNAFQRVKVTGRVIDIKDDEIDANSTFLFLRSEGTVIAVSADRNRPDVRQVTLGDKIEISGTYFSSIDGIRPFTPPCIVIGDKDLIRLVESTDVTPPLENMQYATPDDIARLDLRRTDGIVLATWQPDQYLLRATDDTLIKVRHRATSLHPHVGDHVSVVGFPETDLYSIVLTCADSSIATNDLACLNVPLKTPVDITPRSVLFNQKSVPCYAVRDQLGSLVCVRGRIRDILHQQERSLVLVEDDGVSLPVDVSDHPSVLNSVSVGCTVEATGICVLEGEMWTPMNAMPQLKSYTVVIRSPEDIRILARPPWWTPARLMYVIGGLLVALLGFAVWNRLLNRLVEKRSAALLEEQRTSTEAALKIDERTRLAAELHDSLSQNLSALACQVSAAKSTVTDGSETQALLATAERMLQSSRTELKRCLWDLRGDSLEESDFTNAIRNTLARLVLKAKVVIRFNVPRKRVDDTTAHAILCIVRELVSNAVKHGAATEVRIAGETHGSVISFSVRDNGSGFDTEQACGVTEGHFGLEGIRDRVNRLDGTFEIESKPGTGTKATVQLKMKDESTGNEFKA